MHIYAFGSVCRGDIDLGSDIDMLVITNGQLNNINPSDYSIYSYERINELWEQGNPFAWHLHLESKLVFSQDGYNYLEDLDSPNKYLDGDSDCFKFYEIFNAAHRSIKESSLSQVFDLSTIFLAIRNFATCYSLSHLEHPNFSRRSSLNLGELSISIEDEPFRILEAARILCTRGIGSNLTDSEIKIAVNSIPEINCWMKSLMNEGKPKL
ncbi:nucleotidyltransferase domain-containing protein [Xenorhabdus sp. PB30.3]|uniref:nucleotidyltransferase domain-containing protein n=1 Tax=Xenorhabdus sp. PB30.3 TaxID=2788941 RepID=UPI001E4DE3B3|nr:nucleotidyltransferase domain-containing protein [Xenorhabdus sp. PB30.3]